MALHFNGAISNRLPLNRHGSGFNPLGPTSATTRFPMSFSVLCNLANTTDASHTFLNGDYASGITTPLFFDKNSSQKLRLYTNSAFLESGVVRVVANQWHQAGFDWRADGRVRFWWDGKLVGVANSTAVGVGFTGVPCLGGLDGSTANFFCNGALAEAAIWRSALEAPQWEQLGRMVCPYDISRRTLRAYVSLAAYGDGTSPYQDIVNGGYWAKVGTLTEFKHPPVIRLPTSLRGFPAYGKAGAAGGSSLIKTLNGLAIASVKTVNGLAIASVKTWNGLANV